MNYVKVLILKSKRYHEMRHVAQWRVVMARGG